MKTLLAVLLAGITCVAFASAPDNTTSTTAAAPAATSAAAPAATTNAQ